MKNKKGSRYEYEEEDGLTFDEEELGFDVDLLRGAKLGHFGKEDKKGNKKSKNKKMKFKKEFEFD